MSHHEAPADRFRYDAYELDPVLGQLTCRYSIGPRHFFEQVTFGPAGDWSSPAVDAAARLVFLLAGVSYYKTSAPPVVDLGEVATTADERAFLRTFYTEGLAEFAHRNHLDLAGLELVGPELDRRDPVGAAAVAGRPLVPFGGGIDSIVAVEALRIRHPEAALFVVSAPGGDFEAIERPAALTGLDVVRAEREVDPTVVRSRELGYLNGHVPVTGILSAIAVMAAVLGRRDAVVMSNEWSSSFATVVVDGHPVNHQWSKGIEFETGLRALLAATFDPAPRYFSLLRARSELWVASRFAALDRYHPAFRSCNRAFHIDRTKRAERWCGRCDKCCFVDLILSPFIPAAELESVFDGLEPLADPTLLDRFRALLVPGAKPFECVGEERECRAALRLAAARPDRATNTVLATLAAEVGPVGDGEDPAVLLGPLGTDFVPDDYAPKLSWSDLGGSRVGVWGLGVEGRASLRRLATMGVEAVLVDDRPPAADEGGPAVLPTGQGGLEALERCEVVVKTPGISRRRPEVTDLVERGVAVVGGLGLWMEGVDRDRVVCVTGTKGKSTTASIAGHLLDRLGYRCLVAGNIGLPPYDPAAGDGFDLWVVEVSSFQATDLASSPPVVAVTSLHPDHLDWHGDAEAYFADKLSLCRLPGARLTVADGHSPLLRERRGLLGPEVRWVEAADPGLDGPWADALGLFGAHNRRNALIARACLAALGVPAALEAPDGDPQALAAAAADYPGLASRLQPVATVEGVVFVDDSLSTNVLATLAALDAFGGRRVALLVGGFDRGIDYRPLAEELARRDAPTMVLTLPASGPRVRAALEEAIDARGQTSTEVADFGDLAEATAAGFAWARPDGVVLLSPAAPSFGQFHDYRERAAAFAAAAGACAAPEAAPT